MTGDSNDEVRTRLAARCPSPDPRRRLPRLSLLTVARSLRMASGTSGGPRPEAPTMRLGGVFRGPCGELLRPAVPAYDVICMAADPPQRPPPSPPSPPRPSSPAPPRPSSPSRPPPRSVRDTPAPPLGPPEDSSDQAPDSVPARGGRLGTVPLRPLIDIAQAGLTLTVEREAGKVVERTLVHEGDVCRIGTHAVERSRARRSFGLALPLPHRPGSPRAGASRTRAR